MSKLKAMSAAAICATTFLAGTSQAAVLNFDLSGVGTTAGNISGGFTFDTDLQAITGENASLSGSYTNASNASVDTILGMTTFTLRDEIGLFSLTLELFGFDANMPGILPGGSASFSAIGQELLLNATIVSFVDSTVTVSREPEVNAQVPLPAGLPLILTGLAAFGIARKRKSAA